MTQGDASASNLQRSHLNEYEENKGVSPPSQASHTATHADSEEDALFTSLFEDLETSPTQEHSLFSHEKITKEEPLPHIQIQEKDRNPVQIQEKEISQHLPHPETEDSLSMQSLFQEIEQQISSLRKERSAFTLTHDVLKAEHSLLEEKAERPLLEEKTALLSPEERMKEQPIPKEFSPHTQKEQTKEEKIPFVQGLEKSFAHRHVEEMNHHLSTIKEDLRLAYPEDRWSFLRKLTAYQEEAGFEVKQLSYRAAYRGFHRLFFFPLFFLSVLMGFFSISSAFLLCSFILTLWLFERYHPLLSLTDYLQPQGQRLALWGSRKGRSTDTKEKKKLKRLIFCAPYQIHQLPEYRVSLLFPFLPKDWQEKARLLFLPKLHDTLLSLAWFCTFYSFLLSSRWLLLPSLLLSSLLLALFFLCFYPSSPLDASLSLALSLSLNKRFDQEAEEMILFWYDGDAALQGWQSLLERKEMLPQEGDLWFVFWPFAQGEGEERIMSFWVKKPTEEKLLSTVSASDVFPPDLAASLGILSFPKERPLLWLSNQASFARLALPSPKKTTLSQQEGRPLTDTESLTERGIEENTTIEQKLTQIIRSHLSPLSCVFFFLFSPTILFAKPTADCQKHYQTESVNCSKSYEQMREGCRAAYEKESSCQEREKEGIERCTKMYHKMKELCQQESEGRGRCKEIAKQQEGLCTSKEAFYQRCTQGERDCKRTCQKQGSEAGGRLCEGCRDRQVHCLRQGEARWLQCRRQVKQREKRCQRQQEDLHIQRLYPCLQRGFQSHLRCLRSKEDEASRCQERREDEQRKCFHRAWDQRRLCYTTAQKRWNLCIK